MASEEERFNELVSKLKSSLPYPLNQAVTETPADRLTDLDIAIWIMESKESKESKEIFHEGRLKGSKKMIAGRPKYNSYPINDLTTLVREAALELYFWLGFKKYKYTDCEGPTQKVREDFFEQTNLASREFLQRRKKIIGSSTSCN
jgi:hypothetical protein